MSAAQPSRPPCRIYGELVPLADAQTFLLGGWTVIDDLANEPLGASHVMLAPPDEKREAA
jgi:hypothetical protein